MINTEAPVSSEPPPGASFGRAWNQGRAYHGVCEEPGVKKPLKLSRKLVVRELGALLEVPDAQRVGPFEGQQQCHLVGAQADQVRLAQVTQPHLCLAQVLQPCQLTPVELALVEALKLHGQPGSKQHKQGLTLMLCTHDEQSFLNIRNVNKTNPTASTGLS